jgi:hypothetical protein
MATEIRFLGNVGSQNVAQLNIYLGVIQNATTPSYNGRLVAFCRTGTEATPTAGSARLILQSQSWLSDSINITKVATFPTELLPDLISQAELNTLGLVSGGENYNGTRLSNASFVNDITMITLGFQQVGFGEILGGGVTQSEVETLLQFDLNDDGVIGQYNKLLDKIEGLGEKTELSFFEKLRSQADEINPYLYDVAMYSVYAIGANLATKAITGKPLVGKKGILISY